MGVGGGGGTSWLRPELVRGRVCKGPSCPVSANIDLYDIGASDIGVSESQYRDFDIILQHEQQAIFLYKCILIL